MINNNNNNKTRFGYIHKSFVNLNDFWVHCILYRSMLLLEASLTREQGVTMRDSIPVLAL